MPATNINDQAVFDVARKIDARDARQAYLSQVCGEDAAMAQRVEALLRAFDESASFLESPAGAAYSPTLAERPLTEAPGTIIGPYKLLEQIGEGGMGVVYMAEQTEPVERRVAVKVIKPGMDTRQVIARFEAERQALAMMDHPNIAKVLDAGATGGNPNTQIRNPKEIRNRNSKSQDAAEGPVSDIPDSDFDIPSTFGFRHSDLVEGRPYFVMELVKGLPITRYCDEHHLSLRERLELFVPVLQAVQHAHQKGIIHRDLKPTNVLVAEYDDRAVPKIIDFGVAKAVGGKLTDKTMFTQLGQLVGTLEYMSPEQAKFNQLDVDTRTDIYALGVLLYELLTGTTPFGHDRLHAAAFDEVLRILRDEEPPKPSTRLSTIDNLASVAVNRHIEPARLNRLVRGELDWIVMKALEKDRNRRYETANDFAADVRRHLNDEPIQARPITMRQRMWRWYRRHVPFVAGAFTVFTFAVQGVMYVVLFTIIQFLIRSPNPSELLSGFVPTVVTVLLCLAGAEMGVATLRGKRRGLWMSLVAFVLFVVGCGWSLYWAIAISRGISNVPIYSFQSFVPDTVDGQNAFIRNCVIGYALLGMSWSLVGLVLQVHALCSRGADQNLDARRAR